MGALDEIFANDVCFTLKKEETLVLFEMFTDIKQESAVPIRDPSERRVLWNLSALLEKTLVEPFMPNYDAIIGEAKKRLAP